jgi:mannose-6-phosphate isomerase
MEPGRSPRGALDRALLIEPWPRSLVWGGQGLAERYAKGRPGQRIAESWELSDRADGASSLWLGLAEPGRPLSLDSLAPETAARLFGAGLIDPAAGLPVLFKLIDAASRLSLQVHPGPEHLQGPGFVGAESKEEAWLVIAAEPGAKIFLGLAPGTSRDDLRAALADEQAGTRVEELLHHFEARVGDVYHVRPGMFHAIGGGILLAEVQQSSDTTYRVWDWGRLGDDGRPRALHVDQALEVGRFDEYHAPERVRIGQGALPAEDEDLVCGRGFQMDWRRAGSGAPLDPSRLNDRFAVYCLLDSPPGSRIALASGGESLAIGPGQSVLLPPTAEPPIVSGGDAGFLKVTVPD